jgi:hypothetical protein
MTEQAPTTNEGIPPAPPLPPPLPPIPGISPPTSNAASTNSDSYQGPHNWRKSLKPVQSPVKEQLPDFGSVPDVHKDELDR